ncbi:MAG: hypothetical protein EA377_10340 [Phycisphaerales bacterium]|nr:MAG: hypothetical protein EA377_10340 [Phycisphaerales bacterium]
MADPMDPKHPEERPDDESASHANEEVPVEEQPMEVEAPRRAASAQFEVDAAVGSQAELRLAMDPANQSLADALRLSFRVLQFVIVILIGLFILTGFQTVEEGQSGVLTRWGKIVPVQGQEALPPGLHFSRWPYPIGDFVIVDVDSRTVRFDRDPAIGEPFWPRFTGTLEEATAQADVGRPLRPNETGFVLTAEGDIAHLQMNARYQISNPVEFLNQVRESDADRIVQLALQRAVIHEVTSLTIEQFVDLSEDIRERLQLNAQRTLNEIDSGIQLASVNVPNTSVPLAVRRSFTELQSQRTEAKRRIDQARRDAGERLVRAAGESYRHLVQSINRYEDAMRSGDQERADELLAAIHEEFDTRSYSGRVAETLENARAYRSQVESTLGNEARRFRGLLATFEDHPEVVVRRLWYETYARVLSGHDTEVFYVPPQVGKIRIDLAGLHEIQERRQRRDVERRRERSQRDFYDRVGAPIIGVREFDREGPGRQLRRDGDRLSPIGRGTR